MVRNKFDQLIRTFTDLMSAPAVDLDEDTDACAQRYFESFQVKEMDVELNLHDPVTSSLFLESEHVRIEILGQYFEGRGGTQNCGNYNNQYLYWRLRPKEGEKLLVKHMLLHRFSLAKAKSGLGKICVFHQGSKDFVDMFVKDNKELLTTAIRASIAHRIKGMQIQVKRKKLQKAQQNQRTLDASHGSSSNVSSKHTTPPKDSTKKKNSGQNSNKNSGERRSSKSDTIPTRVKISNSSFAQPKNTASPGDVVEVQDDSVADDDCQELFGHFGQSVKNQFDKLQFD